MRAFAEKVLHLMGPTRRLPGQLRQRGGQGQQRQRADPHHRDQDRGRLAAQRREVVRLPVRHRRLLPRHRAPRGRRGPRRRSACSWWPRDTEGVRPRARVERPGHARLGQPRPDPRGLLRPRRPRADRARRLHPRDADVARLVGRQPDRDRRDLRRHRPRRLGLRAGPHDGGDVRRHRQADRLQPDAPGAHRRRRGGTSPRRTCGCAARSTSRPATRRSCPRPRSSPSWKLAKGAICEHCARGRPGARSRCAAPPVR